MSVVALDSLRMFDPERMRRNTLFETPRFFLDLYCLEPGQSQRPHTHDGSDKVYVVLEGRGTFTLAGGTQAVDAGRAVLARSGEVHGVVNEGPERLVCLVFMAPHPGPGPL